MADTLAIRASFGLKPPEIIKEADPHGRDAPYPFLVSEPVRPGRIAQHGDSKTFGVQRFFERLDGLLMSLVVTRVDEQRTPMLRPPGIRRLKPEA